MPTKLPVYGENNTATKKLWEVHQKNEYTRVNNYKEGLCYDCFSNRAVGATIVDVCTKCMEKRGTETILAVVKMNHYGLCLFCDSYQFSVFQINVRICQKCFYRIRNIIHNLKKIGTDKKDPFWQKMRKKQGKDYNILFSPEIKKF